MTSVRSNCALPSPPVEARCMRNCLIVASRRNAIHEHSFEELPFIVVFIRNVMHDNRSKEVHFIVALSHRTIPHSFASGGTTASTSASFHYSRSSPVRNATTGKPYPLSGAQCNYGAARCVMQRPLSLSTARCMMHLRSRPVRNATPGKPYSLPGPRCNYGAARCAMQPRVSFIPCPVRDAFIVASSRNVMYTWPQSVQRPTDN